MKKTTTAVVLALALALVFTSCVTVEGTDASERTGLEPVKYAYVDPSRPYDAINYGLFDYQLTSSVTTPRGGEDVEKTTEGMYSIFIPKGSQPKARAVIILIPDGTTDRKSVV